jgi:ribonucleoside-diphosphate reductase alpha chain
LRTLGYSETESAAIIEHAIGTMHLKGTPHINEESLKAKGFTAADLAKVTKALPGAFELKQAFNAHILGEDALKRLGFVTLQDLGFTSEQINYASLTICGHMTLEGAPNLKPEHQAVFDCANKCGDGTRFIAPMGHVRMMAATQPFLSGAISKTVNLPNESTVEDIENIHMESWKLGLKAIAVYRDGCKLSQPLTSKANKEKATEVAAAPAAAAAIAAPGASERRRLPKKRNGFTVEGPRAGGRPSDSPRRSASLRPAGPPAARRRSRGPPGPGRRLVT